MNVKSIIVILLFLPIVLNSRAQTMEWVYEPEEFTEIRYMGHDMFKVKDNQGKWGILSSKGGLVFQVEHDSITPFVENRALLMQGKKNKIIYIINQKGEIIQDFNKKEIYANRYPFYKEGLLSFVDANGLCGYLNLNGDVSIDARFHLAAPFQDGVAIVQYMDKNYGIITQFGGSRIVDNTKYKMLSTPIDGLLFALTENRLGDLLRVVRLDGNKLKSVKTIENKISINLSYDFTCLSGQNGHHYYIDEQWRIVGTNYALRLPYEIKKTTTFVEESTEVLSKQYLSDGIQITYKGNPILEKKFPNVETYEMQYAIVRNEKYLPGILRLNPQASIELLTVKEPFRFRHNPLFTHTLSAFQNQEVELERYSSIDVNIRNINVSDLKCYINDHGHLHYAPIVQDKDSYKMYLPYFQSDNVLNRTIENELDIAITYDGLDWMHKHISVSSLHEEGFKVDVDDKVYFDKNGRASFDIIIQSKGSYFHAPILVEINSKQYMLKDGNNRITLYESIPEGTTKKFHYTVKIKEEGCPTEEYHCYKLITRPKKRPVWS